MNYEKAQAIWIDDISWSDYRRWLRCCTGQQ